MKKKLKNLVLAKETVRNLENCDLGRVAGGVTANGDCTYTNCCSGLAGPDRPAGRGTASHAAGGAGV
jgi:hypothetical protein